MYIMELNKRITILRRGASSTSRGKTEDLLKENKEKIDRYSVNNNDIKIMVKIPLESIPNIEHANGIHEETKKEIYEKGRTKTDEVFEDEIHEQSITSDQRRNSILNASEISINMQSEAEECVEKQQNQETKNINGEIKSMPKIHEDNIQVIQEIDNENLKIEPLTKAVTASKEIKEIESHINDKASTFSNIQETTSEVESVLQIEETLAEVLTLRAWFNKLSTTKPITILKRPSTADVNNSEESKVGDRMSNSEPFDKSEDIYLSSIGQGKELDEQKESLETAIQLTEPKELHVISSELSFMSKELSNGEYIITEPEEMLQNVTILKRPEDSSQLLNESRSGQHVKTLVQRKKEYNEARMRIFGILNSDNESEDDEISLETVHLEELPSLEKPKVHGSFYIDVNTHQEKIESKLNEASAYERSRPAIYSNGSQHPLQYFNQPMPNPMYYYQHDYNISHSFVPFNPNFSPLTGNFSNWMGSNYFGFNDLAYYPHSSYYYADYMYVQKCHCDAYAMKSARV